MYPLNEWVNKIDNFSFSVLSEKSLFSSFLSKIDNFFHFCQLFQFLINFYQFLSFFIIFFDILEKPWKMMKNDPFFDPFLTPPQKWPILTPKKGGPGIFFPEFFLYFFPNFFFGRVFGVFFLHFSGLAILGLFWPPLAQPFDACVSIVRVPINNDPENLLFLTPLLSGK